MRYWWVTLAVIAVAIPAFVSRVDAGDVKNAKYIGSRMCRACHRTEAQGGQFGIWENSKHAHAYETLANEQSQQIAQRMGIENPQTDARCLRCHVTAHGVPAARKHSRFSQEEGVGCEACHGAGELYKSRRVMCQITAGDITGESVGLVTPNEQACVTCHNSDGPTFQGFNFEEMVQKIAHPIPEARKQKIEEEGCAGGSGSDE